MQQKYVQYVLLSILLGLVLSKSFLALWKVILIVFSIVISAGIFYVSYIGKENKALRWAIYALAIATVIAIMVQFGVIPLNILYFYV